MYKRNLLARFLCVLCCTLALPAFAQQKTSGNTPYQLLWRISRPGLPGSSYLFGTMHLRDPRVYNFSDSVLVALEKSQDFAMEVDYQDLMRYLLSPNGPFAEDSTNYIRHMFNPDEYAFVDNLVYKKVGSHIDQLKNKRWWMVERLLEDEENELQRQRAPSVGQEEANFLDLYFFNTAAKMGKPVHSLEDIQNQVGIFSAEPAPLEKTSFLNAVGYGQQLADDTMQLHHAAVTNARFLDHMVDIYSRGDLQGIANTVGEEPVLNAGMAPMKKRNQEMAASLDSLVGNRTVFAAVGCAHLPGKEGIIALLRAKGYTVEPVEATFTGITKQYREKIARLKAFRLNRLAEGYAVDMPGAPMDQAIPGSTAKAYFGVAEGGESVGFAISTQTDPNASLKQVTNLMVQNMMRLKGGKLNSITDIKYGGYNGEEADFASNGQHYLARVFLVNDKVYFFMHNATASGKAEKAFFQSVTLVDLVASETQYAPVAVPAEGWSAVLPTGYNHFYFGPGGLKMKTNTGTSLSLYSGQDRVHKTMFIVRIDKTLPGYVIEDERAMPKTLLTSLRTEDSTLYFTDSSVTTLNGQTVHNFHAKSRIADFDEDLRLVQRTNISYLLLCRYNKASMDTARINGFFHSFHETPLTTLPLARHFESPGHTFRVDGPTAFKAKAEDGLPAGSLQAFTVYQSTDSILNYIVTEAVYQPYFSASPDSINTLRKGQLDTTLYYSMREVKRDSSDGVINIYQQVRARYSANTVLERIVVAGHRVYTIKMAMPDEFSASGLGEQFLQSFQLLPAGKDTAYLGQDRSAALLQALQSTDSATFRQAAAALHDRTDSTSLPLLRQVLTAQMPLDTTEYNALWFTKRQLLRMADTAAVDAAVQLIRAHRSLREQRFGMSLLAALPSVRGHQLLLDLWPTVDSTMLYRFNVLPDMLEDTTYASVLPRVLFLAAQHPSLLQNVIVGTPRLFDSTALFTQHQVGKLGPMLAAMAASDYQQLLNSPEEEGGSGALMNDLAAITVQPSLVRENRATLEKITGLKDQPFLVASALLGLQSIGQPASRKLLQEIVAPLQERTAVITAFTGKKQEALITPVLTPLAVSEAVAYDYIMDEIASDTSAHLSFVKKITVPSRKEDYYIFRGRASDDTAYTYMAVGPQATGKLNIAPDLFEIEEGNIKTAAIFEKALAALLKERSTED